MFVTEKARGRGIAKLLMHALFDFARGEGYSQVFLTTTTAQRAALRLYTGGGFRVMREVKKDLMRSLVEVELRINL